MTDEPIVQIREEAQDLVERMEGHLAMIVMFPPNTEAQLEVLRKAEEMLASAEEVSGT